MMRKKEVSAYFAQRKTSRLARWMKSDAVVTRAGLAGNEATVQSGECWVVLLGAASVGLTLIISATKSYKGGHRPETDRSHPHLLKDTTTLSLDVYGTFKNGDGSLFGHLKFEFTRTPWRLMAKLEQGTDVEITTSSSGGRSKHILTQVDGSAAPLAARSCRAGVGAGAVGEPAAAASVCGARRSKRRVAP